MNTPNMLFWFENDVNYVMAGKQFVFLLSMPSSRRSGFCSHRAGFKKSIAMFSAKRLINDSWGAHDDVYLAPVCISD